MPSFYHPQRNYVLSTSMKVMFSTLTRQPRLQALATDLHAATKLWLTPGIRRFLLVRNPYDRLVSFHADKFYTIPANQGRTEWQKCQQIFFPALALSGRESTATIAARLQAVSFEQFIDLLPQVFQQEIHLWPQCRTLRLHLGPLPLPAPGGRVLKMESESALLVDELDLDLSIRANATAHEPHAHYFTATSYAIANEIYRADFDRFGYPFE